MPASIKVQPLGETISLMVKDTLSPEAQQSRLAVAARRILAEAEQINEEVTGRFVSYTTTVDGRVGALEETVRPNGGVIEYSFDLVGELFAWIGEQLVLHSPVLTGRYAASHKFFADGIELEPTAPIPPGAKIFTFISDVPYARKIEKGLSPQAPDGVYQSLAALASRRFHNVALIRFQYQSPLGGGSAMEAWASTTKQRRSRNAVADALWNRRQPAIVITLR